MGNFLLLLRAVAAWAIAACLFVLAATAIVMAVWLVEAVEDAQGLSSLIEGATDELADSLTEAGFGYPPADLDSPLLAGRRILITESINERTAKTVVRELLYLDTLDPAAPIDLYIATYGGWLDNAFAIVDAMDAIEAPVNTIAIGGCHSAGSVILAGGTGRRLATPRAIISVHLNREPGDEPFSFALADRQRFERLYRERAHLPEEWFPLTGEREYFMTAEQALEHGLIDAVLGAEAEAEAEPLPAEAPPL